MRVQPLISDDLNKRSAKHTNKSTLVARGVDTQLGSSCVSAPLATNVDLWNPIAFSRTSILTLQIHQYHHRLHPYQSLQLIASICYHSNISFIVCKCTIIISIVTSGPRLSKGSSRENSLIYIYIYIYIYIRHYREQ